MKSSHSPQAHFSLSIPRTSSPIFKFSSCNHTPRKLTALCADAVTWVTLPVSYLHFRLFFQQIKKIGWGEIPSSSIFVIILPSGSKLSWNRYAFKQPELSYHHSYQSPLLLFFYHFFLIVAYFVWLCRVSWLNAGKETLIETEERIFLLFFIRARQPAINIECNTGSL